MITPNRQFHRVVVVVLMLTSLMVVLPRTASAQDTSDAAHRCQQGGWEKLRGSDGTTFANQGECVSYAAQGGQLREAASIFLEPIFVAGVRCGFQVSYMNYPTGQYYLEWSSTKYGSTGSYVWVHASNVEGQPWWFVQSYWVPDGLTHTITATLYNVERSLVLSSDTLEIQC